jgi:hypothetical protein
MSPITLDIPDELEAQLRPLEGQLTRILEPGLREYHASRQLGFEGAAEVLELLAALPSPEEILALRPSGALQEWISDMLEKNRATGLTATEQEAWEQYQYLEHLVRFAKARAALKLHEQ